MHCIVVQDRVAEAEREMDAIDTKLASMVTIVDEITRVSVLSLGCSARLSGSLRNQAYPCGLVCYTHKVAYT